MSLYFVCLFVLWLKQTHFCGLVLFIWFAVHLIWWHHRLHRRLQQCTSILVLSWHFSWKRSIAFRTSICTCNFCFKNSTVTATYFFIYYCFPIYSFSFSPILSFPFLSFPFHSFPSFSLQNTFVLYSLAKISLRRLNVVSVSQLFWWPEKLLKLYLLFKMNCLSRWPRGLRRRYLAARLVGLRVRIPPVAWTSVSCECCVLWSRGICEGRALRGHIQSVVCLSVISKPQ